MNRFHWHPDARLFGTEPKGGALPRPSFVSGVQPDRPMANALAAAFGDLPFRIGAVDAPAPLTGFETLTSGSTGAPRRIARDVASWQASFAVNARLLAIKPGVQVAVLGRLVQSLSLYGAVEALSLGADLHMLDGLRPDRQRAALAARGVQVLWTSPPQMQLLAEGGGPDLPAMRHVLLGGAKLDADLRAALVALCPNAQVQEFYGAAEASFISIADANTPPHSVGRPYPDVEIGIGGPNGTDATGRIWVRSPYLFNAYASADAGVAEWCDGWLGLGEIGRMDAGHLVLLGRMDRMVTVAGQNAYPEAIEQFLLSLSGVQRAAVVPRPDDKRGTALEAVLVGNVAPDDILAALRQQFGPLIAPKQIHMRQDWPLLPSGKVDLAALAEGI